uniref:Ribosomal protein S7 n=1 Tax=Cavenderia fasciculata TaxID=261658 RepID=B2XX92_CACFS|nr:ribosomal protein S7 [Cavenderia fasciculata]ABX45214.1 ribosomal protein S7 [Cavenderia fasciculata]
MNKKTFEQRFIGRLMRHGKYIKAEKIYMEIIVKMKKLKIKNIYKYVRKAIYNITPIIGIKLIKKGRKRVTQVPVYLTVKQAEKYALNWLLKVVEKKKVTSFSSKIVYELINAYNKTGAVMQEKWKLYQRIKKLILNMGVDIRRAYFKRKRNKKKFVRKVKKSTKIMKNRFKRKKWLKFGKF